jgi:hypothetical protein
VPLVLGLLVTLLSGIVLLLAHKFTLAAILGYSVASMLIVVSEQIEIRGEVDERTSMVLIVLVCGLLVVWMHPAR